MLWDEKQRTFIIGFGGTTELTNEAAGEYLLSFVLEDSTGVRSEEPYNIILTIEGDPIVDDGRSFSYEWDWSGLSREEKRPPVPSFRKVGYRGLLEIEWTRNMRRPREISQVESGSIEWFNEET